MTTRNKRSQPALQQAGVKARQNPGVSEPERSIWSGAKWSIKVCQSFKANSLSQDILLPDLALRHQQLVNGRNLHKEGPRG